MCITGDDVLLGCSTAQSFPGLLIVANSNIVEMYLYALIIEQIEIVMKDGFLFPRIHPDLRTVVYPAAIAAGSVEEWDFLWNWYKETTDPHEKQISLLALSKSTQPWILSR